MLAADRTNSAALGRGFSQAATAALQPALSSIAARARPSAGIASNSARRFF
jgi:hypothetical protein